MCVDNKFQLYVWIISSLDDSNYTFLRCLKYHVLYVINACNSRTRYMSFLAKSLKKLKNFIPAHVHILTYFYHNWIF